MRGLIGRKLPEPEGFWASLTRVTVEELIRSRRTHKAYEPEPVDRATLEELFELARWAPNHNLTNPWRFRVLGPQSLARAEGGGGPRGGRQARPRADARGRLRAALGRPRHRSRRTTRPARRRPSSCCSAPTPAASAGYWRTPGVLRTPEGRAAVGIPESEHVLGLVHLGRAKGPDKAAPERAPLDDFRAYLP